MTIVIVIPDAVVAAAPSGALIALLALWLVIRVRRRRRDERRRKLLIGISTDFFPPAEHSAIEEIRREVDASHKRFLERELAEAWKRDGGILLERRRGP